MSRSKRTPETTDSRNERDHSVEARLWRCVLHRAVLEALTNIGAATVEARNWLTGGGSDLLLVCEFAGLDAGMVNAWALEMQADGWPMERAEEYRQRARGHGQRRMAA